jgi:hypothetical protein
MHFFTDFFPKNALKSDGPDTPHKRPKKAQKVKKRKLLFKKMEYFVQKHFTQAKYSSTYNLRLL